MKIKYILVSTLIWMSSVFSLDISTFVGKGDKIIGPVKIISLSDNRLTYYIYPDKKVIDIKSAEVINDKFLKPGNKVYIIKKSNGDTIIFAVEAKNEKIPAN